MCHKRIRTYDNLWATKDDYVAVYDQLAALHYTPERVFDPTKAVTGVDRIEDVDGREAKLYNSGWYLDCYLLKVTHEQYQKWIDRHGLLYIEADDVRRST